jgi:hypothetical protein
MSLATTAILASAIRPKNSTPSAKPSGIVESISQKPLQWLVVAGVVVYFGQKFLGKVITTGSESRTSTAETSTSTSNPFSFKAFLGQKIPKDTKILSALGSYKAAKQIYDALDVNWTEDEDIAVGVFTALPSKVQVAQVAQSFYNYYKTDILEFLKNGNKTFDFFGVTSGISDAKYQRVIDNVTRKPKF